MLPTVFTAALQTEGCGHCVRRFEVVETPILRAALELYDAGFNIGPTKPASKLPFVWRILANTRVDRNALLELFSNGAGIFVLTGRSSSHLAILECDTRGAADDHQEQFAQRGLRPWVVETARGYHFWWLSADGELANIEPHTLLGDAHLLGNLRYALCPPSIHPSGVIYQWHYREGDRPPAIPIAALDWLPLKLAIKGRRKFESPAPDDSPLASLSQRNRHFIENGAQAGERNNRLFMAACDLKANNFAESEALKILIPTCERSGFDNSFTRKDAYATVKSAYGRDRERAKKSRPRSATPIWKKAASFAQNHHWHSISGITPTGKTVTVTGETAHRVFRACHERSRRDQSEVFRALTREAAELANTSSKIAYNALCALTANGYLVNRGHSDYFGAGLFAFGDLITNSREGNNTPHWSVSSDSFFAGQFSDARADVFRPGALGKLAESVWGLILTDPLEPGQIAKQLKRRAYRVREVLSLLEENALAERVNSEWSGVWASNARLQEIARKYQTAGKAQSRRDKHRRQRELYVTEKILSAKRRWERRHARIGQRN